MGDILGEALPLRSALMAATLSFIVCDPPGLNPGLNFCRGSARGLLSGSASVSVAGLKHLGFRLPASFPSCIGIQFWNVTELLQVLHLQ